MFPQQQLLNRIFSRMAPSKTGICGFGMVRILTKCVAESRDANTELQAACHGTRLTDKFASDAPPVSSSSPPPPPTHPPSPQ